MKHSDYRPVRQAASRFKGVVRHKDGLRWDAQFYISKHQFLHLGRFTTEEEAARAYDEAARSYRGNDAFLNFRDIESKTRPVLDGPIARVPLAAGGSFQIDVEDLGLVGQYYWRANVCVSGTKGGGPDSALNVVLLGPLPPNHAVVHLNGHPLDFRRKNLAVVPMAIRCARNRKQKGTYTSIYKGVRQCRNRWEAKIAQTYLGTFATQEEAAFAYDEAARRKYGIFAALNFPGPGEVSCLTSDIPLESAA